MTQSIGTAGIPEFDTADRMRKSLRESGIGVQEIATYFDVSRNTVGNWINGRIEPSVQTLRLWAMRTNVPFKWLQTGESPRPGGPDGGDGLADVTSLEAPNSKKPSWFISQVATLAAAA